ncbi:hypothetical protein ACIBHX_51730 [Nonomuraea sp. NPDC050536]
MSIKWKIRVKTQAAKRWAMQHLGRTAGDRRLPDEIRTDPAKGNRK